MSTPTLVTTRTATAVAPSATPASTATSSPTSAPFVAHHFSPSLVSRLGDALRLGGVRHCLWKGDPKCARFEAGKGDLDILIDRDQAADLRAALAGFGFRPALAGRASAEPGVVTLFAPHPEHGGLLHLHVHLQLLVGSDGGARFRLPIERALLEGTETRDGLRVPGPALAYLVHLIHETLQLDRAMSVRPGTRVASEQRRIAAAQVLATLADRTTPDGVEGARRRHLPWVSAATIAMCEAAFIGEPSWWQQTQIARRLQVALHAHRRRSEPALARWPRRLLAMWATRRRGRITARALPANGGTVVALIGGDGSGKSTCARQLDQWLGAVYDVQHLHLGRPPRGVLTLICGALKRVSAALRSTFAWTPLEALDEHLTLARVVCTGRDRARAHARAHRHATQGGIAICERHPLREFDSHAGPRGLQGVAGDARSRLADWLRRYERGLYAGLSAPDLTLVLRLPPETAVRRKPSEPSDYVRRRAEMIWQRSWDLPGVRVIDAERPLPEVMRELRARVWEQL